MTRRKIGRRLAVALAVAAAGAVLGAAAREPAPAGAEIAAAGAGAYLEPAWPVCLPARPAGGAEGADMDQTDILTRAGGVPPIDAAKPAVTEVATFALG